MNPSKLLIDLYDTVTFPIAFLGYLYYLIIETPLFVGRMRASEHLSNVAHKSEEEEGDG